MIQLAGKTTQNHSQHDSKALTLPSCTWVIENEQNKDAERCQPCTCKYDYYSIITSYYFHIYIEHVKQ